MAGKVISFINMKGGVGKTTLCIGIAEYLAEYRNKHILLIDLDPQFNTTQSIMNLFELEDEYLNNYCNNKTVKRLFEEPSTINERPKMPTASELIIELDQHLSIVAGSIHLVLEDKNKSNARLKKVKKFIFDNHLNKVYDYIFIDCPPTISLYTDAALVASDYYLVPIKVDRYSILGVRLLQNVIDRLTYEEELTVKPLGKIYTMIDQLTDKTRSIIDTIEADIISTEISSFNNMTTFVRDLMVGNQGNISSKYKKSKDDIEKICNEFLKRIEDDSYDS